MVFDVSFSSDTHVFSFLIPNPDSHTCLIACPFFLQHILTLVLFLQSHAMFLMLIRWGTHVWDLWFVFLVGLAAIASLTCHSLAILVNFLSQYLIHGCLSRVIIFSSSPTRVASSALVGSLTPVPPSFGCLIIISHKTRLSKFHLSMPVSKSFVKTFKQNK